MVFHPSGVICILVKVLVRNVVVLAGDHATKAREVAFSAVCVGAVQIAVHFAVVDAVRF